MTDSIYPFQHIISGELSLNKELFFVGLPDESGRLQILNIHTAVMRENDKLATDVDLGELATLTKNFSGAEIEGLVRCAQATAMNRLIKVESPDQPFRT